MMKQWIQQARQMEFLDLNALEWFGVVAIGVIVLYAMLMLRDLLSGTVARRKQLARQKNVEMPVSEKVNPDLPQGKETVLIVDDDPAVLRAHSRLVGKLGYNVERAQSGQAAIDFVKKQSADLIILDLLMPEMDGMETFRAIKKINPKQRAIVLSGFAGPAMVSAIKSLGVGSYLVKPAQVSILAKAIREELDRKAG